MNTEKARRFLIVYHNDLDGWCSAAIIHQYLKSDYFKFDVQLPIRDIIFHEINYGMEFPWHLIDGPTTVYMLDFSLSMEYMDKLNSMCSLVWIDHHVSAMNDFDKYKEMYPTFNIYGLRVNGDAACELTWYFIYGNTDKMPLAVKLLANYDIWNHSDPKVLPFQYYMRAEAKEPSNSDYWSEIFKYGYSEIKECCEHGKSILKYLESEDEKYCKTYAYEAEFESLRAIVLNKGLCSSNTFKSVYNPDKHDIILSYVELPNRSYAVSLRSDKDTVDCSRIAKKYGGGGHSGAAGCRVDNIKDLLK